MVGVNPPRHAKDPLDSDWVFCNEPLRLAEFASNRVAWPGDHRCVCAEVVAPITPPAASQEALARSQASEAAVVYLNFMMDKRRGRSEALFLESADLLRQQESHDDEPTLAAEPEPSEVTGKRKAP